jgi:hypothetical protein
MTTQSVHQDDSQAFGSPFESLTLKESEQQENAAIQRAVKRLKDATSALTSARSHSSYHNSHGSHRSRAF